MKIFAITMGRATNLATNFSFLFLPSVLAEIPRTTRTYEFYRLVFPSVVRFRERKNILAKREREREKKEEEFE